MQIYSKSFFYLADLIYYFSIFRSWLLLICFLKDKQKKEKQLYFKKHKITQIHNKITLIVDEKPTEVGIDPYNKLIDTKSDDNRRKF